MSKNIKVTPFPPFKRSGTTITQRTSGDTLALGAADITMSGSLGVTGTRLTKGWFTDLEVTNAIAGAVTGNAGTVTNATLTTALTVNTGTVTLTGNVANTSVLTIGAGAVSVSGANTGDQTSLSGISDTMANFDTACSDGNFVYSGGALGTPSSATLTNATGLPLTGLVDDTTTALGVGTIELGHATDTTLSRSAAGVLAVEGVVIPSISSTNTLTNKRITQRVVTTTDDATAVIDVDTTDVYELSAVANATTFSTTGTPTDGQKLMIRFKDAGVAKDLTWDAIFVAIGVTAPTTTVAGKWTYCGLQYNSAATKWHLLATGTQA